MDSIDPLTFPPLFAFQGIYRLTHDHNMWWPMWDTIRPVARKALLWALGWAILTWPLQRLVVGVFMHRSAKVLGKREMYDKFVGTPSSPSSSSVLLPSLEGFATFCMLLTQCQRIVEFLLRRQLRMFRQRAYAITVKGVGDEWWEP